MKLTKEQKNAIRRKIIEKLDVINDSHIDAKWQKFLKGNQYKALVEIQGLIDDINLKKTILSKKNLNYYNNFPNALLINPNDKNITINTKKCLLKILIDHGKVMDSIEISSINNEEINSLIESIVKQMSTNLK